MWNRTTATAMNLTIAVLADIFVRSLSSSRAVIIFLKYCAVRHECGVHRLLQLRRHLCLVPRHESNSSCTINCVIIVTSRTRNIYGQTHSRRRTERWLGCSRTGRRAEPADPPDGTYPCLRVPTIRTHSHSRLRPPLVFPPRTPFLTQSCRVIHIIIIIIIV
jgi:hypothetical protein